MSFDRLKVGRHTTIEEEDEVHLRQLEEAFKKRGMNVSIERSDSVKPTIDISWGARDNQGSEITLNLTEGQVSGIMRQITEPVKPNGFKVGDSIDSSETIESPTVICLTGDQLNSFFQQLKLRDFDDTIMDDSPKTLNASEEDTPLDIISYRLAEYVSHAHVTSLEQTNTSDRYLHTSAYLNVMESNMGDVKVVSLDQNAAYMENPIAVLNLLSTASLSPNSLERSNKIFRTAEGDFVKLGIVRDAVHWSITIVVQTFQEDNVTNICISGNRISLREECELDNGEAAVNRTQVLLDEYLVPEVIRRANIPEGSWLHTFLKRSLSSVVRDPQLVEGIE